MSGRKGFGARALVGACLVKSLFALPTWTWVPALIAEHPGLQDAFGDTPSVWAICDVAIDASDVVAHANGHRYVPKNGPEREQYSDPDASWGAPLRRQHARRGRFYGYKLHLAACVRSGVPLAWQIETARRQESLYVAPLLDAARARGFNIETCAMDKGYDNARVYAECEARDVMPVIPLRGAKGKQTVMPIATGGRLFPQIPRHTERFRELDAGRSAAERAFAQLKREHGLATLRVRGIERVRLHADLTISDARAARAGSQPRSRCSGRRLIHRADAKLQIVQRFVARKPRDHHPPGDDR